MKDPLSYLFGLEHLGIKFGLQNIRAIAERLGHPERAFQSIHVAGTNGKGSVTAMVETALREAGHRAARYTSPHLQALNERFVIDGEPVPTDQLAAVVDDVRVAVESLVSAGRLEVQPTFFEVATAVAFELFRRARVQVAVLEVGMGGRLDATNIVDPVVTAITTIALDHQQFLGRTLTDIAREKAGIVKPGVPVVVGRLDPDAEAVIASIAAERNAEVIDAWNGVVVERRGGADFSLRTPQDDYGTVVPALRGDHQIDNGVVAVRVLEQAQARGIRVPRAAIAAGLTRVAWPGRLECRRLADGREMLLDAAHNPAGARVLAHYLRQTGDDRLPLVCAVMRDKDVRGIFEALLPAAGALVVTQASTPRSAEPAALARIALEVRPDLPVSIEPSPAQALAAAWRLSPRIVVAGSIFLLGDAMHASAPSIP